MEARSTACRKRSGQQQTGDRYPVRLDCPYDPPLFADPGSEDAKPGSRTRGINECLADGHEHPGWRQDLPNRSGSNRAGSVVAGSPSSAAPRTRSWSRTAHSSVMQSFRSTPLKTAQIPLWQERVRLDEGFYQSLIEHPLPLRETAIKQISSRSMAIDLYVWLAYRLHVLTISRDWVASAAEAVRGGLQRAAFLPADVLPSLKLALAVYPEAHLEVDERSGLTLYPSPPPVPARKGVA